MSGAPNRRRVVVTGLGAVSPLGIGAKTLHDRWAQGIVGIVDGEAACREFDPKDFLSVKEARRLDRFSQFALVASSEATEQAGWGEELPYDPIRIGCVVATGIGGIQTVETQHDVMRERGVKMVSPLGIPQYMPNAAAAAVSMKHGLQGQMYGVVSACSGGAHALGSALRMIQYGDADAVVAGGAEATLTEFGYACFNSMQALSDSGFSRPFDARRDGFVMGEGAGIIVLEELEADTVILALGQEVDLSLLNGLSDITVEDGVVAVGPTMMTGHRGVFAGGDMVPAERTVTVAVGHGKKAARNIDAWLRGAAYAPAAKHELAAFDMLNTWYYSDAPVTVRPRLDMVRRQSTFDEVVEGLDEETALFEARRCLSCGNCFECDNCYGVCPDNAVIKLGPGRRFAFDYDFCKGCGICVTECPAGAIVMEPELI